MARRAGVALLTLLGLVAVLATAGPAGAASSQSCARKVIDDWYDNSRVDGTYALHCYDDAIEALPRDVRDYSSAKEDIRTAMTAALRKNTPTEPAEPSPDGDPSATPVGEEPPTPPDATPDSTPKDEPDREATPPIDAPDPASASSIPIPLLILAGLALLLVAGGSAGYLVRRFRGPQSPPPAV